MANEHLVGPEDDAATESWRRIIAAAAALFAALLLIALIVLVSRSNQERDEALALERSSHEVMMATGGFGQALAQSEAALRYVLVAFRLVLGPLDAFLIWLAIKPYGKAYRERLAEEGK